MAEKKYESGEPPEWKARVSRLKVRISGQAREIFGPCPRCGHDITKDLGPTDGPTLAPPVAKATYRVVCNCDSYHAGAPVGTRGCGAEGTKEVP
jgi:hypothetical protein